MISVSNLSLAAVSFVSQTQSGATVSQGTAFFYWNGTSPNPYLITNWHVVTGRFPATPRESQSGAVPTRAIFTIHAPPKDVGGDFRSDDYHEVALALNRPDGDAPTWMEHPKLRYRADLVAFELDRSYFDPLGPRSWAAIQEFKYYPDYAPAVMDDVFVIGFPWGLTGGSKALPLFKRGSIASEPAIDQSGLPRFLIDCRTAAGMSGSPVIGMRHGISSKGEIGTFPGFLGVYSGRLTPSVQLPTEARDAVSEIGIVWRRSLIDEIIEGGRRGTPLSDLLN